MTNLEKASKIASKYERWNQEDDESYGAYNGAMEMAAWKDKQFAEEKKQWIDKAADYIYTHAHVTTFGDIRLDKCSMTQFVNDFKKAMEE